MCGIAGILTEQHLPPVPFEELRRMVAVLRHRGPDGYGLYRDDRVGLAHARLSIIDLGGGAQPIHNEDKSIWVSFNGEIFNYIELRAELLSRGHAFYTETDTEVIVHCFEEYGEGAWERFNGQFAFALWDSRRRRLWLVRDRVGIHPLFYARCGKRVLFGSEAKALFASGHLTPQIDGRGVGEVFTRWSASAPSTVFQNVCSVPPATALCFDEDFQEKEQRYWWPDMSVDPALEKLTLDDAADALDELMTRAVRLRLRADVPVGAYLSGGLDSSVISRVVRDIDTNPLQTFGIRFKDPAFDETVHQRRMSGLLGTEHHEVLCGEHEICDALPEVIWHCESPLLRTAPAPLFLLSRLVRQRNMKVVLTGEGADELLAGYHIFKEDKVRRFWASQPDSQARPALLSRLYPYMAGDKTQENRLWQQFFRRGLTQTQHPFYSHRIRWENTAWSIKFLSPELCGRVDQEQLAAELERTMPPGWRQWRPLARAQIIEVQTFLSSYLLSYQGDRVALGHGIEVRYPFLDPDVFDFCCRLPRRLKLRGLRGKVALRKLASRRLPPEIWQRPKQPYRAPTTSALFGGNAPEYVSELLSQKMLEKFGLVDCNAVTRLVTKARERQGRMSSEREEMALVGLLTLQLLADHYSSSFSGRVYEARAKLDDCEASVAEDHAGAETASC